MFCEGKESPESRDVFDLINMETTENIVFLNYAKLPAEKQVPKKIFDVETDGRSFSKGYYSSTGCVFALFVKHGYIFVLPEKKK